LAIKKLQTALKKFVLIGCTTNIPILTSILRHRNFQTNNISTSWLENKKKQIYKKSALPKALESFLHSKHFFNALYFSMESTKLSQLQNIFKNQFSFLGVKRSRISIKRFSRRSKWL
jgi:pyruvate carboxylase